MFEIKDKVGKIVNNVEDVAKTYYKLSVMQVVKKGSNLGSALLITLLIFGLLFFTMLFVCFGLSWWIGQRLNNQTLGFFIVAGGLFVILLLLILLRKKVIQPFIRNIIINIMYG